MLKVYIYKKTRKTLRQTVGRNFLWRPVRALLRSRGIFLPKNNIALQYSVSSIAYPSRFEREREAEKTKSRIETRRCKRPLHEINVQPDTCSSSSFLFFLFSFFHSFSPPFIPTRRLLFRFERISTMKSFRFSEIAEQTFDSLDFSKKFPFLSIRNAINRRRRRRRLLEHRVYIIVARNETLPERNSRGCRNLRWWNNVHDLMLNPLEARAPDRGNYRG